MFILVTQLLVYYKLIAPYCNNCFNNKHVYLLALSTALIAIGGYIINDYFDVKIDEINKPYRVTVEIDFKRRWVMMTHILVNICAFILAYPITKQAGNYKLFGVQIFSILLLVIYSANFKRRAFIGNISIAVLSFLSVFMLYMYLPTSVNNLNIIYMHILSFGIFAFLLTWIREIIKDLEDIKGDEADNCTTMPISYGITFSKNFITGLLIITLLFTIYFAYVHFNNNKTLSILFATLILLPLFYCTISIQKARQHKHYKFHSRFIKLITFTGIILMLCL